MTALGYSPGERALHEALPRVRRLAPSKRFLRLQANEAMWKGLRYELENRPDFWTADVPLRERAPAVQSQIVRTSVGRLAALAFGADKFPKLEPKKQAAGLPLGAAERTRLSELLTEVRDALALPSKAPLGMAEGLGVASCCAVLGLDRGRLTLDWLPAKDCEPTLARDGSVERLEFKYRFGKTDPESGRVHHHWYRRVIEPTRDRVWSCVPCDDEGYEPEWDAIDPDWSCATEFAAVVWHRNMPDPTDPGPDGVALFEGLEAEVEALDFALSQRHRNARYNGEPQTVLVGVDGDAAVGATGRTAGAPSAPPASSWAQQAANTLRGWFTGGSAGAVKKAPNTVWKIPAGGDAKMLESSGAGAQILSGDADDLTRRLHAAVGVVMADPQTIAANASAALLGEVFRPMLDTCGRLREEWTPTLCRIVDLALRLLTTAAAQRDGVVGLASLPAALPVLRRLYRRTTAGEVAWQGLPLDVKWGEYFRATWSERQAAIAAVQAANGGQAVISRLAAVKLLAPELGIDDAETELAAIDADESAGRSATQNMLGALGGPPFAGTQHPAMVAQQQKLAGEDPAE